MNDSINAKCFGRETDGKVSASRDRKVAEVKKHVREFHADGTQTPPVFSRSVMSPSSRAEKK